MLLTEKHARQRWNDSSFQAQLLPLISAIDNGAAILSGVDLAGVSIGQGPVSQLWEANLHKAKLQDVDMAYSKLACSMNEAEFTRVRFTSAELNRCLIRKGRLLNCNFDHAKLVVNLDDSFCEGCSFSHTSFLGGKSGIEYGGRRVRFVDCNFTNTLFKGVEFRAAQFINCSFEQARFVACDLRGVRVEGEAAPKASQFEQMDLPEWAMGF